MEHIVLVIHLIITVILIILIMLQRSEGGGLGLGSSGGLGNFASVQSTANALTKTTTYFGAAFFATSIILAIMAARGGESGSILDAASQTPAAVTSPLNPASAATEPSAPSVPVDGKTATPAPASKTAPAKENADTKSSDSSPAVPIAK